MKDGKESAETNVTRIIAPTAITQIGTMVVRYAVNNDYVDTNKLVFSDQAPVEILQFQISRKRKNNAKTPRPYGKEKLVDPILDFSTFGHKIIFRVILT